MMTSFSQWLEVRGRRAVIWTLLTPVTSVESAPEPRARQLQAPVYLVNQAEVVKVSCEHFI